MPSILANKGLAQQAIAILSCAILLGGILTIAFSAYIVVVSYSSLPYWDGWIQINFAAEGGNPFTLDWLWTQYNEHRMPIPKLFLLADLGWVHARQVFLLACVFVIQSLHLLLLSWSMRVFGGWRGALWRTGVGLAAFCLFCPAQWENLTWGMQVCFVLPGLLASLSFVGLLLYWKRSAEPSSSLSSSWKYLLLSLAAALGAAWSYVNGNLLWLLLPAAALLLQLRLAAVSYAVAGALSTIAYLYDYIRPSYAVDSMKTPVNLLKYLSAYFGSTWVDSRFRSSLVGDSFRLAEIIGVIGLAVCISPLLRLRSYVGGSRRLNVLLVLTLLFCVGSGLSTALGRSSLGIGQAFSSRYQTVSLIFWCCLGLLWLGGAWAQQRWSNVAVLLSQVTLLAIMLVAAKYADTPLIRARMRGFRLNAAAMSLVTNVPDPEQLRWAFWRSDYLPSVVPYMRQNRLSVFDEPSSWLLGKPLEPSFSLAPSNQCSGDLESTVAISNVAVGPPALRIAGWAWDQQDHQPPSLIVAVTDGMVTGLAAMGDWHPLNKGAHAWQATNYLGYTGYVQAPRPSGPVEIYAILKGSPATACLIATAK